MLKATAIAGTIASASWHFSTRWSEAPAAIWPGFVLAAGLMTVWIPVVIRLGTTTGQRQRTSGHAWLVSAALVVYAVVNSFLTPEAPDARMATMASGHLMAFYGIAAAHLWRRT